LSEPIPTCISIGGKIAAKLVPKLCRAIADEGMALDWGDASFGPTTADDLLAACEEIEGTQLLWLCDEEASYGRLDILENFLVRHRIPFDLQSDGKYEYSPALISYRPGEPPVTIITGPDGDPIVSASQLQPVSTALEAALRLGASHKLSACLKRVKAAKRALEAALPPAVAPLPEFEIG
jgi:hypothetical protein